MSRTTALAAAKDLRAALLDHGVRRVSIELQAGRGPSSDRWHARTFRGVMSHHIVSRRSMGLTPGLALVKRGRADLTGPLANGYGGFDLTYRVISLGWANHPGRGGPLTLDGARIPADNGRPYLWGTEYEGGLDRGDWTDEFREFMGRANAGICDWLGLTPDAHAEHRTWTPRKIDRLGYTTAAGRAEIRRYTGGTPAPTPDPEEPDMQLTDEVQLTPATAKLVGQKTLTVGQLLSYGAVAPWALEQARSANARAAAMQEVLSRTSAGQAVDYAKIEDVVSRSLATLEAEVTVRPGGTR